MSQPSKCHRRFTTKLQQYIPHTVVGKMSMSMALKSTDNTNNTWSTIYLDVSNTHGLSGTYYPLSRLHAKHVKKCSFHLLILHLTTNVTKQQSSLRDSHLFHAVLQISLGLQICLNQSQSHKLVHYNVEFPAIDSQLNRTWCTFAENVAVLLSEQARVQLLVTQQACET